MIQFGCITTCKLSGVEQTSLGGRPFLGTGPGALCELVVKQVKGQMAREIADRLSDYTIYKADSL